MKRLKEISLRLRIFLTLIFSILLGAALLFWLIGFYEIKDYKERVNKESIIQLSAIEASITEVAVIGDYATIKQILHKFITVDQDIINISYKNGNASIDERNSEIEDLYPEFFSSILNIPNNITITTELDVGGQSYGTISLTMDSTPMINIFWNKTKNVAFILFIILLVQCVVLLILINTSFMPSLYAIQKCSQDLSKGVKAVAIKEDVSHEIKDVLIAFNNMAKAIDTQKKELIELNQNLEEQVKAKINELRSKDQLLIQQSKLASMGEMIGAIAHQWRQPLNILAIRKDILVDNYYSNELDNQKIDEFDKKTDETIQYMSKTIDDFRDFFIASKSKILFNVVDNIISSKTIVSAQLKQHNISLTINENGNLDLLVYGYPNEFKQVIINLINNAKDAILNKPSLNKSKEGFINIDITCDYKKVIINITDNGGGIKDDIINKIFEPYFTTKFESLGTGLGLYMSKTIIEKNMSGLLEVENIEDGAKFSIELERGYKK